MTKKYCDRCKRELPLLTGIVGWRLTVTVTGLLALEKEADLCPDCQRAVYEFVFGEEE